jgi:hypothetical protein
MVLVFPGDGRLRPVHELGFCRHNSIHLCLITLVWLASSRTMLLVLLTSSRLCLRRSRELPRALLQLSHEPALMHGVGRFPARGVVEFARLVKHSIEGVLALFVPLTAAGSPQASLVRSHLL